jgi:hypothetical protein
MGDASPSQILGSADGLPSRPVRGKNGPVDADASLYSIWRRTPYLHRPVVCIVGGRDGHGAAIVMLRDQPARYAACVASRPRNNRAVLRTLISIGICLSPRGYGARRDHSGAPAFRRPSNKRSSRARNVWSSLTPVHTARSREIVYIGLSARPDFTAERASSSRPRCASAEAK